MQVDVNFGLREMTEDNKAAAELAIDRIKPGGGTNLSGGLFKGIDQHQQAPEVPQQSGMSHEALSPLFTQLPSGPTAGAVLACCSVVSQTLH